MSQTKHRVIKDHISEYPEPITFSKGTLLTVGERYEGPEQWEDWFFCEAPGQKGGWVPGALIEMCDGRVGRATEDYTARELNVKTGETVIGTRRLNGWVWCSYPDASGSGWVPLAKLQPLPSEE